MKLFLVVFISTLCIEANAQLINSAINPNSPESVPICGSFDFMKSLDSKNEGFMELSNGLLVQAGTSVDKQKQEAAYTERFIVPVVFHIVYNDITENIPDSVIFNQMNILNECFRRQNADAVNTRSDFLSLVGDTEIEFELASFDPMGNPTNGITRTLTSIEHFGGILPYGPGQNQQISDWVEDSLFINYFRMTESSMGGEDPWDTDKYLNVWIGDLRIFEPQFSNFEELVYFALATPPENHVNWPTIILQQLSAFNSGVLLHYVNVGSNNPNSLPSPYNVYNGKTTTGKMLVHEAGHYLGLRHIWGDGNCSADDYINDTPLSSAQSNYNCNQSINSCVDTILGQDLPDMVENYMDYSSGPCQNAFTIGQSDLMRSVLEIYRPDLAETISLVNLNETASDVSFQLYPNPNSGSFNVVTSVKGNYVIKVYDLVGKQVYANNFNSSKSQINLNVPSGIYTVSIQNDRVNSMYRIVIK